MEANALALLNIVQNSGLDKQKQDYLLEKFSDATLLAEQWAAKAKEIVVTDESQTDLMKSAREGRLLLKDKRVEIEKTRKQLKEASLAEGRAIDTIAKTLTALIEPTEKYLDEQEKFAERKEAERVRLLNIERLNMLAPYITELQPMAANNYGVMPQLQFDAILLGYKTQHEQRIEAARKAEEERIAKEEQDKKDREAQRIENERLKKEAEEREKAFAEERKAAEEKAKKERAEIEAKAKAEREESERKTRIEREAREKAEKELREKQAAEEKERLALEALEAAPDKEKIKDLLQRLIDFELPLVKTKKSNAIVDGVKYQLQSITDNLRKSLETLK